MREGGKEKKLVLERRNYQVGEKLLAKFKLRRVES